MIRSEFQGIWIGLHVINSRLVVCRRGGLSTFGLGIEPPYCYTIGPPVSNHNVTKSSIVLKFSLISPIHIFFAYIMFDHISPSLPGVIWYPIRRPCRVLFLCLAHYKLWLSWIIHWLSPGTTALRCWPVWCTWSGWTRSLSHQRRGRKHRRDSK